MLMDMSPIFKALLNLKSSKLKSKKFFIKINFIKVQMWDIFFLYKAKELVMKAFEYNKIKKIKEALPFHE